MIRNFIDHGTHHEECRYVKGCHLPAVDSDYLEYQLNVLHYVHLKGCILQNLVPVWTL